MADVRSIFDGLKSPAPPAPEASVPVTDVGPTLPETTAQSALPDVHIDLAELALAAAKARDAAEIATWAYQRKLDELMADVNSQVADLQAEAAQANRDAAALREQLCGEMTKRAIDVIPLPDRPACRIKVSPGKRKGVTKTLLEKVLEKDKALQVWNAVETGQPEREVIIPPPYEPDGP